MEGCSLDTRTPRSQFSSLSLKDEMLNFRFRNHLPERLVLPRACIVPIVKQLHQSLGQQQAARQRYWWPNMREDVDAVCAGCRLCERAKSPNNPVKAALQPIIGGFPNGVVGIDIKGPLPQTNRGHKYILVMVDYFTKWPTARPIA